MTPLIACMVCAQPVDALLASGLHAGVAVMAAVAIGVMAALVRGVIRLLREDRAALAEDPRHVGQSLSSADRGSSKEHRGSSNELPYIAATNASDGSHARG
jgi:hypothetical protein